VWSGSTLGAAAQDITRTNLETGQTSVVATLPEGVGARSLNFNRDFSTLYIANAGGPATGTIYTLELDEDLEPLGEPEIFAEGVGQGWLDGIAVDACGALYVPDSHSLRLYRVSPDGDVDVYVDWRRDETEYGHAVVFGSGIGGWRTDALYLPMPYGDNRVREIVLGVPSRTWTGEVLNRP
jgi:hypothetical protein